MEQEEIHFAGVVEQTKVYEIKVNREVVPGRSITTVDALREAIQEQLDKGHKPHEIEVFRFSRSIVYWGLTSDMEEEYE